ncbi:MAG: hypothetical protein IT463_01675 [Planctomycetes bacterium]|nr:hypothetical protein [Planctomycetota bacterium]
MEHVLYWIAGIATALFAVRLVLMLIGFDHDAGDAADALHGVGAMDTLDAAHAAADVADFKIFTLMTLLVTGMVGSWSSILGLELGFPSWASVAGGYAVGFVAALGVAWAMYGMKKLESDGTVRTSDAEGLKGTCYVAIPEGGKGQVQVVVKGRLRTFDAVSDGPAIASFKQIVVMTHVDDRTVRVCATE